MSSESLSELKKMYVEWHVDVAMDLLDQIIKSPEMISETNTLSPSDINRVKQQQRTIATKAVGLEADEIIKKNKVKNKEDLCKAIEKMPEYKIKNLRKKFIMQAINGS